MNNPHDPTQPEPMVRIPLRLIERLARDTKSMMLNHTSGQYLLILTVSDVVQTARLEGLPDVTGLGGMRDYYNRDVR